MDSALTRKEAEWLIESLLASLDELDSDPDLEDVDEDAAVDDTGCDDPHEDDEDTHDRENDPADGPEEVNEDGDGNPDDEPSLCGIHADSGYSGTGFDAELDDSDMEPSLGWTTGGTLGDTSDRESDAGDEPESENEV
jgi:hypothetical protein